jgi:iron complex transport system substrate-binding protein
VAADPDTILVMTKGLESVGGIDGLVALPGVAQTTAGRERRVIAVDDTLLLSFGPRTDAVVQSLREGIGTA